MRKIPIAGQLQVSRLGSLVVVGFMSLGGILVSGAFSDIFIRYLMPCHAVFDQYLFCEMLCYMIISFRPGWLTIGPDLSNSNYDWGLHQVKHLNLMNLKGLLSLLGSHNLLTPKFF